MRVLCSFRTDGNFNLPFGYNSIIQGFIYNILPDDISTWVHDKGFTNEKRKFKLFCFSWILERPIIDKENSTFYFKDEVVSFYLSSPVDKLLRDMAQTIISRQKVRIGRNNVEVEGIKVLKQPKFEDSVTVNALTPIEVHSTLTKENGKPYTYYYAPHEEEFRRLVQENAHKKWKAYNKTEPPVSLVVEPLFEDSRKFFNAQYFGTGNNKVFVKGYKGQYRLSGSPEMLEFIYDSGLGGKNSQGFGFIKTEYNEDGQLLK